MSDSREPRPADAAQHVGDPRLEERTVVHTPGLVPGGVEGAPGEHLGAQPAVGEGKEEGEREEEEEKDAEGGGWADVPTRCEQTHASMDTNTNSSGETPLMHLCEHGAEQRTDHNQTSSSKVRGSQSLHVTT